MNIKLLNKLILQLIILLSCLYCTKEDDIIEEPADEIFNFIVADSQRIRINESRGEQFKVKDPVPILKLGTNIYKIDKFEIRGDNTLNFRRKGFSVNMDDKITLFNPEDQTEKKFEEFKLLAMVYDYTYIENSIATGLFKEVGLWPVYSFFTEVRLNDHTQGLYFFIEDPFEYMSEQENSSFVMRRGYYNIIKKFSLNPTSPFGESVYKTRFRNIYSIITDYSGQQIYDSLSAIMDLEQYFTKLSVDLLIKNGDYTDEIIFYSKIKNDREIFGVIPWDFDDIFADQPHEIGNDWATGDVFGDREYNSMDDIIEDVGSILLFSIEDDLDYKIAKDSVLYQRYLITLRTVIDKIDITVIDKVFDKTSENIGAFYLNDSIISQSRYDADETNRVLFMTNLSQKRQLLKERREWIIQELDKQQN